MISMKPMAMVAMLALVGGAVAQENVDEQRIAELIEQLKGENWDLATTELLDMGGAASDQLARAVLGDIEAEPGNQMWKARVLDTLTFLGSDAADAAPLLYEAVEKLPWQLTDKALHALAEVAPYAEMWFAGGESGGGSMSKGNHLEFFYFELIRGSETKRFQFESEDRTSGLPVAR